VVETTARSDLAQLVLDRLTCVYPQARDPLRARAMASSMRYAFPFLGIPTPRQRFLALEVTDGLPQPRESDLRSVALGCWALPEREFQYFACGYLRRYVRVCSAGFLPTVAELVTSRSWWDTVDPLAAHVVGPLVMRYPRLAADIDRWALERDVWLVRSAMLHQLHYHESTNANRLFHYCTEQCNNPNFFVRKAIGWALREYALTDPGAVRRYVGAHRGRMSPLSAREALRNLTPASSIP
jgi:3-methyladenine DNA glycosylase AlkD